MASGLCDWEGDPHPRNRIITTISPPVTVESCDDHYLPTLIALMAIDTGTDADRLTETVRRFLAAEEKRAAKATEQAARAVPHNGPGQPPTPGPGNSSDRQNYDGGPTSGESLTVPGEQVAP